MIKEILNFIWSGIKKSLLPSLREGIIRLFKKSEGISFRDAFTDFISILRTVWVFLTFITLVFLAFVLLPQGKDIILVVVEDTINFKPGSLFALLAGLLIWSVIIEFGARYSIYIADNSGAHLSEKRVLWRKALQRAVALSFFILPYLTILLSLAILYLNNESLSGASKYLGFGIPAVSVYLLFNWVSGFYLRSGIREEKRRQRKTSTFWRLFLISREEKDYADKLYGIYNNFVFSLPRKTWFISGKSEKTDEPEAPLADDKRKIVDGFYSRFMNDKEELYPLAPQGLNEKGELVDEAESAVRGNARVSSDFELCDPGPRVEGGETDGYYRWVYKIPFSFFRTLHLQLWIISISSIVIFLFFSMAGTQFYEMIGSPGLVFISFACWSGIYTGLIFLDKRILHRFPVSIRLILFLWMLFCSISNTDHPVRLQPGLSEDNRPPLSSHYQTWLENYLKEEGNRFILLEDTVTRRKYSVSMKSDSIPSTRIIDTLKPVFFVCAEGGALRTGGFSAMYLSLLADTLKKLGIQFNQGLYAMSGVSGGALGLGYYNAITYLNKEEDLTERNAVTAARRFFEQDFLAPNLGKLLYGDVVNLFLPFNTRLEKFDRAIALEKSWEKGYGKLVRLKEDNIFSSDFRSLYGRQAGMPALFINTTEVETGLQCWITNVIPDSMPLFKQRDLLGKMQNRSMNYSTAINFSSRFPLIAPGAMVPYGENRYHYVDAGYVENTGAGTMSEIIETLLRSNPESFKKILPVVIVLKFGEEKQSPEIRFGNELTEIISGIYNTRAGRAALAEDRLKTLLRTTPNAGIYLSLSLNSNGKEVPLNWTLSAQSLFNIEKSIAEELRDSVAGPLIQLPFLHY